jgi:hypothetical protein
MSDYVCKVCWSEAIEIGELAPGYGVVLYREYFHIVSGPHKEDIIITFENTPTKDPKTGLKNYDADTVFKRARWLKQISSEFNGKLNFPLDVAHHFINALLSVGWDGKEETYQVFIYNRTASLIENKLIELSKSEHGLATQSAE